MKTPLVGLMLAPVGARGKAVGQRLARVGIAAAAVKVTVFPGPVTWLLITARVGAWLTCVV